MLTFIYSTVSAGKSANLIMRAHSCSERNIRHTILVPTIAANRDGNQRIFSRVGLERIGCIALSETDCPFAIIAEAEPNPNKVVFVDEAQFLTRAQVLSLTHIVDELSIPVFAYGLRSDFKGQPFEGSIYLMTWADRIEEIASFNRTEAGQIEYATFNMKIDKSGNQITSGEILSPGFDYQPVSRKRFNLK